MSAAEGKSPITTLDLIAPEVTLLLSLLVNHMQALQEDITAARDGSQPLPEGDLNEVYMQLGMSNLLHGDLASR